MHHHQGPELLIGDEWPVKGVLSTVQTVKTGSSLCDES